MKIRILTILEALLYLDDKQHVFHEGRSTLFALSASQKKNRNTLLDFKYCAVVLFNIAVAFDIYDWHIVADIINLLPI